MIREAFCSWEQVPEFRKPKLLLSAMAEFLGTFTLIVMSVGAIRFARIEKITQIACTFGMCEAALVCMFGRVSGGHFNPAVTASFAIIGKTHLTHAIVYVLMQLFASVLAAFFLGQSRNRAHNEDDFLVYTQFTESTCILEAIATFLIVLVTLTAYGSKGGICKEPACLVIGFSVLGFCFFLWDFTGSCLNPLRAFGPAVVYNDWTNHVFTWIGPMIGALLAAIVYEILPKPYDCQAEVIEKEECPKVVSCPPGNPVSTFVDNFWRIMLS